MRTTARRVTAIILLIGLIVFNLATVFPKAEDEIPSAETPDIIEQMEDEDPTSDETAIPETSDEDTEDATVIEDIDDVESTEGELADEEPSGLGALEVETQDAPSDSVALMNGEYYSTLQDAIDAAEGEATITLVGDVVISETVKIPSGKNITITDDGSARTISHASETTRTPMITVAKGATLTLDGTSDENLVINSPKSTASSTGIVIRSSGTLNIKNGTINGNTYTGSQFAGMVYVSGTDAELNMSGGIVQGANFTTNGWYCSGVYVSDGAVFNMSGGTIRNNSSNYRGTSSSSGGGVTLMQWNKSTTYTTMNMTGGEISGNSGKSGGGVYLTGFTNMTMTGGEIIGNKASYYGGGVCVSGSAATPDPNSSFVFDGGTISNNRAHTGGGVYVNTDEVYLRSGYIENNTAYHTYNSGGHGGGVYVSQVPRVLHIENALITENTAKPSSNGLWTTSSGMGGGFWACPTGSIAIEVTNGIAIFDNQAIGNDSAGDDVVKVAYQYASTQGSISFADRVLGGGLVTWAEDGGINDGEVGTADTSIPRYDETDVHEIYAFDEYTESVAVKAIMSDGAKARAESEAKLYIRYNTATHGGGLGTNGDITLTSMDYPSWKLQVEKVWSEVPEEEQKPVKVYLKIGEDILDYVTLTEENEWKGSFEELPDITTINTDEITVVEGTMTTDDDGNEVFQETTEYNVEYEKAVIDDEYTIQIAVINSPKPEDNHPEDEDEDEEEDEDEPDEEEENPDTGDSNELMYWIILAMIGGAGLTFVTKKQHENRK